MQIDLEHVTYWMDAIRQSPDPIRTLESFWRGQIKSKQWLLAQLDSVMPTAGEFTIDIVGGWNGVLASLLFQHYGNHIRHIRSIDIDPACEPIANMMNKAEEIQGRFTAVTSDMCALDYTADIVINTSCEHVTQAEYDSWLSRVDELSIVVLQSNNYEIDEHVRTAESLEDFVGQSRVAPLNKGVLVLPLYCRYMIIGRKNV
jgi:hypothetical protein